MVGGAAPGWYPDPGSKDSVRYWDGVGWTAHTTPASPVEISHPPGWPRFEPPPADPPPPPNRNPRRPPVASIVALAVVVLVAGLGVLGSLRPNRRVVRPAVPVAASHPYDPALDAAGDPAPVRYGAAATPVDPTRSSLPAALYAVPSGANVVTPASARAAALALWTIRRDAIAVEDRATLAKIETGSALAIDTNRGCGCGRNDQFGPATKTTIAVANFSAFPATFYAEVETTLNTYDWDSLLVFTRASSDTPWRVALAGGSQPLVGRAFTYPFAISYTGYAGDSPPDAPSKANALTRALADYWQDAKDGRTPPASPHWTSGAMTDKWAQYLAQNRQGEVHSANGLKGYYRYTPDPHTGAYVVALDNAEFLACASIIGQTTFVAPPGHGIVQAADRNDWGPDVAPGTYRAVITIDDYTPCFAFTMVDGSVNAIGVAPPDEVTTIGVP